MRLLDELNKGTLMVPKDILELEEEMEMEWFGGGSYEAPDKEDPYVQDHHEEDPDEEYPEEEEEASDE